MVTNISHSRLPRSLLIVGMNYWPETTGNAPYTTRMATHLAKIGVDVTVVCGVPYYPEWSVHEGYRGKIRMDEVVDGVRVKRFRTHIPTKQSVPQRLLFDSGFIANATMSRSHQKPDAVVGAVGWLSGLSLTAMFARRFGVPYGLIFHDLFGNTVSRLGGGGDGVMTRSARKMESSIARRSAAVGLISESFRPFLLDYGVADDRIWNLPSYTHIGAPTEDRGTTRARLGWSGNETIVVHAGNIGIKQGLDTVVDAARLAHGSNQLIRFVFLGDGSQRLALRERAIGLPNVQFIDPVPDADFPNVLSAADILLLHERRSAVETSFPSKLTSYFAVGRPVLAAVSDHRAASTVADSGAGVVVASEDAEAIIRGVARIRDDPDFMEKATHAGPDYASKHFSADVALRRTEEFVAAVTRGNSKGISE